VAVLNVAHDGVALAANAGIDDGEEHRPGGVFAGQRGEEMRCRRDAEGGRVVQRVDDARARRALGKDCLYLADVEVG
jgi:hypothetical protein